MSFKRVSLSNISGKYVSSIDPILPEDKSKNDLGLIWFDTTTNTTVLKVLVNVAGVFSWKAITLGTSVSTGDVSGGSNLTTVGRIPFVSASATLNQGTTLFWDSANSRVGIGTASPNQQLEITASFVIPTTASNSTGVIYKGVDRFIHNFALPGTDGYNTFVGVNSGNFTMLGSAGSQGSYNTASGYASLYSNTTGANNTASGFYSLYSNTTGANNTASGSHSLQSNTTGVGNTASGYASLSYNTTGASNTASGYGSLLSNTTGANNTASGYASLYSNTTGGDNTASGFYSLLSNTTGAYNTASGLDSGRYIADGATANQTSSTSVYLGNSTKANADGDSNEIVIGYNATGYGSNTAVLGNSSITTTVLRGKVGIGATVPSQQLEITASFAMPTTASSSTGVIYKGASQFIHNFALAGTDGYNTFIGINAGNFTMTGSTGTQGSNNTAIGVNALSSLTTGYQNTSNGFAALYSNTGGYANTASGMAALYSNVTGYSNTAIGFGALYYNTFGTDNTATGRNALRSNVAGYSNVALGEDAGWFILSGAGNTSSNTSLYLGNTTKASADGNANEIVIGDSTIGYGSNTATLGNTSIVTTVLRGKVGIGVTAPSVTLAVLNPTATTGATRVTIGLGAADSASTVTLTNSGTTKSAGYQSSDGSAGSTGTITIAGLTNITVKNGLITAYS